ncbi:hypothetical protein PGT21_008466 [Puccinia graminis f. sp. tritici]|uniref:Uncharacterized protein n=1 Tax=Puccinia graminis f. sp. tritici TaxID=56615 RepID=A0A5B0MCD3_PUCGR|nr:hypothetical protein PGT21_008466 [Puccinia graminis f. sp. tritici]
MRTFGLCSLILFFGTINLCAGLQARDILPASPCDPKFGWPPYIRALCCDERGNIRKEISKCNLKPPKSVKHTV